MLKMSSKWPEVWDVTELLLLYIYDSYRAINEKNSCNILPKSDNEESNLYI